MKRLGWLLFACGFLGLGAVAPAARAADKDAGKTEVRGHRGGWGSQLTDEQKAKMKAAFRAHRDALTPLKDKLQDERDALRRALDGDKSDAELQTILDKLEQARTAIQAEKEKFRKEMGAIVPVKLRARFALRMGGHPMLGGRPGMSGPRPGMWGGREGFGPENGRPGRGMGWREGPRHEEKAGAKDDDDEDEDAGD